MVDDVALKRGSSLQLTLSIGKLSQLAQMQDHDIPTDKAALDGISPFRCPGKHYPDEITAFDDGLDIVAVQEDLVQQFMAVKASKKAKQSFETLVENVLKVKATRLAMRPAHAYVRFTVPHFLPFLLAHDAYPDLQTAAPSAAARQGLDRRRARGLAFVEG